MARGAAPEQPEDLRTNARLLALIYDHTSDPVYLVAVEGDGRYRFVSVNETFLRVSGYQAAQVMNAPMERVVPPANVELVRSRYAQVIATREPVTYEERAELPAGTRFAEITLIPIHEGCGPVTHILADIRDLTARRVAELERARVAEEALRAHDEFLAVAAHELRGPITSIHLAVQALLLGKLPADAAHRTLELIEREDRRLSRFVGELLDLGRLRAGRLQLQLEDVELGTVVQDVVRRVGQELAASGSSLALSIAPGVVGEWDRFRLEQLVTNLLSNAIKFGLGRPIDVSVIAADGRARLAVRDHGIGVAPEARERIFLPFERDVSSRNYGGLGLGLHIVKTIVGALAGTVGVEGEPGAGTTFTVVLPLRAGEAADAHPGR